MPILIAAGTVWYISPATGIGRAVALIVAVILASVYEVIVLGITGMVNR
jgi:hypothetical protein